MVQPAGNIEVAHHFENGLLEQEVEVLRVLRLSPSACMKSRQLHVNMRRNHEPKSNKHFIVST